MIIAADTHCHTLASTHAYSTVSELAKSAFEVGLAGLAITDHAMAAQDSPHLWHFHNLPKALPRVLNGVTLLFGVELNIMDADGAVDMDHDELQKLDWVVASMHKSVMVTATEKEYTKAYLKLCENPYIDVVGHPCTPFFPFDEPRVLAAFRDSGKLFEVNESNIAYKGGSAENYYRMLKLCKDLKVPIVVNSDAHFCGLVGKVPLSMDMLKELDFPEDLVFNANWNNIVERVEKVHGRKIV